MRSWVTRSIKAMDSDTLRELLFFATGSRNLPTSTRYGGTGSTLKFHATAQEPEYLPVSHTCFNRIDLPRYTSFAQLDAKLRQAIAEARNGGFQFA